LGVFVGAWGFEYKSSYPDLGGVIGGLGFAAGLGAGTLIAARFKCPNAIFSFLVELAVEC
jgi:hypothetical protein